MIGVLAFFLPFVLFAGVCEEVKISDHVPVPPYTVESKREVFGLCEMVLKIGGQLIPVYASKDFVISGEMFSYKRQITQVQLEKVRKKSMKEVFLKIETLRYVSYKPENAREGRYFYFISDPDCPYCESIKQKVKELADRYGWEVRLVWFPLPFHKDAKGKAVSFLCEGKLFADYLKNDFGKKKCEEGERDVEKNLRVLRPFVRGTPTFIFPDGTVVVGADARRLEEALR